MFNTECQNHQKTLLFLFTPKQGSSSHNPDSVESVTKTFPSLPHRHLTGLEEFDQTTKNKKSSKTRHDERRAELFGKRSTRSPIKGRKPASTAAKDDLMSRDGLSFSSSSDRTSSNASTVDSRHQSHSRTSSFDVGNDKDFMPFQSAPPPLHQSSNQHHSLSLFPSSGDEKAIDQAATDLDDLDIC